MKTKVKGSDMIYNALTGVGKFNKANRATDVKTVLQAVNSTLEIKAELDGSLLKINCTHMFEAEPEIHAAIEQLVNGHVTRMETARDNGEFRTYSTFLIVDLLQPRI